MSLLARLAAWRWDRRITRRAMAPIAMPIFAGAPDDVVHRWATKAPTPAMRQELRDAIFAARITKLTRERRKAAECENVWRAVDAALAPPEE